jgi:hypothetical protein
MSEDLQQALARNRLRIVSRTLDDCGYRVEAGDKPPLEPTATCRKLEEQLLEKGIVRRRGLSLRRVWARMTGRDTGYGPSLWIGSSLRRWWQRHRKD